MNQVLSGFRMVGIILGFFSLFVLLVMGILDTASNNHHHVIRGCFLILAAVLVMLATVQKWAKWFFAASLVNALRLFFSALLGVTVAVPAMRVPRITFLGMACLLAIMSFLTYRFVRIVPNRLDSFCLTGAVIAILHSMVGAAALRSASVALLFLLIAFSVDFYKKKDRGTNSHNGQRVM